MISKIKKYFQELDAILISSVPNIIYITGFNGFSENERECFLLITKNKNYLITDKRYSEAVRKVAENFEVIEVGAQKFLKLDHDNILKNLQNKKIGVEKNNLNVLEFEHISKFAKNIKNVNLEELRLIKNSKEIQNIRKACSIGDSAFKFIITKLKKGVSEKEISDDLEIYFKFKNAESSFKPIVAFGPHSSIPHHQSSNTKLKPNQIVLLDFGVRVNGYCSDMTRTIFFGKADKKFKKIYETILNAQQIAIKKAKPEVKASTIDKYARDYILEKDYPNIIHSLGHGIGLDVHEPPILSPNSNDIIKKGMVFSVEPGIYIPGYGGIRIEDIVLVRSRNAELISKAKREIISLDVK